jgi:enoyl-CoA hydratase/carnithine racemase
MGDGTVAVSRQGSVAILTMDRPGDANRLDAELATAVADACATLAADDEVRVVVVAGSNVVFATGLDLPMGARPAAAVAAIAKPTIAYIGGDCLDQGLALALACDVRIAASGASFAARHVSEGRLPMDGGTQRLSRLVGRGQALRLLLTGDVISTDEALRIGLVELTGDWAQALELAERMASAAPIAAAYGKEAVLKGLDIGLEAGLRLEADLSFLLHTTEDRAEGLRGFRDRTSPKFEGK